MTETTSSSLSKTELTLDCANGIVRVSLQYPRTLRLEATNIAAPEETTSVFIKRLEVEVLANALLLLAAEMEE